ncbi:MAG: lamin tail domain-containing protein [Gammaproteobacteria bacterium]
MTRVKARYLPAVLATAVMGAMSIAAAQAETVRITEWMYQGGHAGAESPPNEYGEFIEFTNMSSSAIDMTGWSFDDDSRAPGTVDFGSVFGVVAAGESVILTDLTASSFRSIWNLDSSVKVYGNNGANLGRADEINLYDAAGQLADRLTYNDQGSGAADGPRTQRTSARPGSLAAIGANSASLWVLSALNDVEGSYRSTVGSGETSELGSPGTTSFAPTPAPVPLPAAAWLLLSGLGVIGGGRLKRGSQKSA